ncbi:helix-turn-helix domain-containing protein [Brevibacterium sediminis]|uniref:helix-turn-helix domain-containing protein n=1 Tax=Brevibacterium sediminis TaxID=1857024 RepID=UPI003B3A798E
MIDLEQLLTSKEVAETLQCTPKHVNTLRKSGDLPAMAIGGMWRYDPRDLRQYVERQRRAGAQ